MRNGSLGLALLRGAAEARPNVLALVELDLIAWQVRVLWCAQVPWSWFVLVILACRVVGQEARHHGRLVHRGCP